MTLTREAILDGHLHRLIRQADPDYGLLTEDEMRASQRAFLDGHCGDLWVFAYGSLIWNPAFHFAEHRCGRLGGYHRQFCLWTPLGRGTPDNPGLMCGLEFGGSCTGLLYRIDAARVETETWVLWRREMLSGAYDPRRVPVRCARGGRLEALTFVINRRHPRYAGRLSTDHLVRTLATAEGYLGANRDYLFNVVRELEGHGVRDRPLAALARRVAAHGPPDGV